MNFLLYTKYAYVMLFLIFIYLVDLFFIHQTSSLQCVSFLEHLQHLLA